MNIKRWAKIFIVFLPALIALGSAIASITPNKTDDAVMEAISEAEQAINSPQILP